MTALLAAIALPGVLLCAPSAQEADTQAVTQAAPFPSATALEQEVSPEALARLDALMTDLVNQDQIVGAELLVIQGGRSILHEGYGWRHREEEVPMGTGNVFCVRSMTKPLIGTAIAMLLEDRVLKLDETVAQYLPAFDVEGKRQITVGQLLTHTSGLPMSCLIGQDLKQFEDIQAVAALGAEADLEFEPGSAFRYSDQGTDTLTALIEAVTGTPPADFVRSRILDPLGMRSSTCEMTEGHPLRERACSLYVGSPRSWSRFWQPTEPSIFPCFLGSQGLYASLEDYALFLEFWNRRGRSRDGRLLRSSSTRKALRPGPYPMGGPTGLPNATSDYASLMQLWTAPDPKKEGERHTVAFGHTGSDGTHGWVFPEQDAMVLYFTQSRGTLSGLQVEEVLGELFLGEPFDPNQAAPPLERYLGYYWEGEGDVYRAIVRDGDGLGLEILDKGVVPLGYLGDDRWKLRPNPSVVLEFDSDEEGQISGYHIGDHQEFRFTPAADLPSAKDLAQRAAQAHRLDLLETLGPLRVRGSVEIPSLKLSGESTVHLQWPNLFRFESKIGEESEWLGFDGMQVRAGTSQDPIKVLEGEHLRLARTDHSFARMGDWFTWHDKLTVIQRLEKRSEGSDEPEEVFLVRTGDAQSHASTLYIHGQSGRIIREDTMAMAGAMGRIGKRTTFGDFRDVSGILWPHRVRIELANPMIGVIESKVTDIELGVRIPEGLFRLED